MNLSKLNKLHMKMKQKEKYYILNIFKLHSNKFVRRLSGQTAPWSLRRTAYCPMVMSGTIFLI